MTSWCYRGVRNLALRTRVVGLAVGIRWPRVRICPKAAALPVEGAESKGGATKAWGRAARPAWCALLGVDRGGGQPPVVHLELQRRERLARPSAGHGQRARGSFDGRAWRARAVELHVVARLADAL